MKKKKIEETVTDTTKIETKTTTEQQLENIEKLLKEIVEILKRKHPSSTDIFGDK